MSLDPYSEIKTNAAEAEPVSAFAFRGLGKRTDSAVSPSAKPQGPGAGACWALGHADPGADSCPQPLAAGLLLPGTADQPPRASAGLGNQEHAGPSSRFRTHTAAAGSGRRWWHYLWEAWCLRLCVPPHASKRHPKLLLVTGADKPTGNSEGRQDGPARPQAWGSQQAGKRSALVPSSPAVHHGSCSPAPSRRRRRGG